MDAIENLPIMRMVILNCGKILSMIIELKIKTYKHLSVIRRSWQVIQNTVDKYISDQGREYRGTVDILCSIATLNDYRRYIRFFDMNMPHLSQKVASEKMQHHFHLHVSTYFHTCLFQRSNKSQFTATTESAQERYICVL